MLSLKFELLLRAEQYGDAYRLGERLTYNAVIGAGQSYLSDNLFDVLWETAAAYRSKDKNKYVCFFSKEQALAAFVPLNLSFPYYAHDESPVLGALVVALVLLWRADFSAMTCWALLPDGTRPRSTSLPRRATGRP